MRVRFAALAVCFCSQTLLLGALTVNASVVSTFGTSTEGWLAVHFPFRSHVPTPATGSLTYNGSFGNPPGSVRVGDVFAETGVSAPAQYRGDKSSYYGGTLAYDIYVRYTDNITYPAVVLNGGTMSVYYETPSPALNRWQTRIIPLTESGWRVSGPGTAATRAQFQSVLQNLVGLYINTEWRTGPDDTNVDNVVLSMRDVTVPVVTILGDIAEGEHRDTTSVAFRWTAVDDATEPDSIQFFCVFDHTDSNGWAYDTTATFTGLTEGFHRFEVRGKDKTEKIGTSVRHFGIDFTEPSATLVSGPSDSTWVNSNAVTFCWSGLDNLSGPTEFGYSYSLNESAFSPFTGDTCRTFEALADTTHVFRVKSKDKAGHESPPLEIVFFVDVGAPVTTITAGPVEGSIVASDSITMTWRGVDDHTPTAELKYSHKIDNGAFSPYTADTTHAFTELADGEHTIVVKTRDLAGNEDVSPPSRTFLVDTSGPTLAHFVGPTEGSHLPGTTAHFEWRAADATTPTDSIRYSFRLDTAEFTAWGLDTTATFTGLSEGLHVFELRGKDQLGNIAPLVTRNFGLDVTPPNAVITEGPDQGACWPNSSATFKWTGTDNVSHPENLLFSFGLDSTSASPWDSTRTKTFSNLAEGDHTFVVAAKDKAGNRDATPDTTQFTVGHYDLVPTTLDVPDSALAARAFNVDVSIANSGTCALTGTWQDGVYLSHDDVRGSDHLLGTFSHTDTLPPSGTYQATLTVTLPDTAIGTYWLIVVTDSKNNVFEEGFENNNAVVSAPLQISIPPHPDLRVTRIVAPQEAYSGQGVYIEWTVANSGDAPAAGGWTEYVYLSTDSVVGADEKRTEFKYDFTLGPGMSYTHVHPLTFPENALGDRWIVVCTDAKNIVKEWDSESNNCFVSLDSVHVSPVPVPNLVVDSVAAPSEAHSNDEITVSWVVRNAGGAPTSSAAWFDKLYLSPTTNPTGPGVYYLGKFQNPSYLGPQEAYSQQNRSVTIPKQVPTGTYYLVVVADGDGNVFEGTNEGDNTGASSPMGVSFIPYPRPDLAITNFVPPTQGWAGSPIRVSWTVTNHGNAVAQGEKLVDWVMLSADSVAESSDIQLGGIPQGDFLGSALPPDSSYSRTVYVPLPSNVNGQYYLFVWTDVRLEYDDSDWLNNFSNIRPITIHTPAPPDLVVSSVSSTPDTVVTGVPFQVQWRVDNEGAGTTRSPAWNDAVYLSSDNVLDPATDTRLTNVYHSGYLEPDAGYTGATSIAIPNGVLGTRYIFVYADVDNGIEEASNSNNWRQRPLPVNAVAPPAAAAADLRVASVSVPADAWSGSSFSVSWTVTNHGPDPTPASTWYDYLYLSADSVLNVGSDVYLGSKQRLGSLAVGASYEATGSVALSNGLSGSYYLFVRTDAANHVFESGNEGNNTRHAVFAVHLAPPPDLRVTQLTSPPILGPTRTNTADWTVANLGTGGTVASGWVDRFYLSSDSVLSIGSDRFLTSFTHSGALAPGGSYHDNRDVPIPSGYTGAYYLIVKTDADNAVYEHGSDGNNTRSFAVTMETPPPPPAPDLVLMDLSFTDGERDTLRYTAKNESGNSVPTSQRYWTDRFYLSVNAVLDGGDILIGSYSRSGDLAPGTSYSRGQRVTLPAGTAGEFYLFGVIDAANGVVESQDANNSASRVIHVELTPPDLQVTGVSVPDTLVSGQPATVVWTAVNQGTGLADPEEWYDGVYLSRDQILDNTDMILGSRRHTGGLAVGAVYDGSLTATIPLGISGRQYVFVAADKNNNVYEYDREDNNVGADIGGAQVLIPLASDLIVTRVEVADSAVVSGDSVLTTWTVRNQSPNGVDGAWSDAVYISSDSTWDVDDKYLGVARQTGGLSTGAEYVQSLLVPAESFTGFLDATVPGLVPGGYHIVVRTDIFDNINESIEDNNSGSSAEALSLDVTELVIGVERSSAVSMGEPQYYKLHVPPGRDVRFTMNVNSPYDEVELFMRYGELPDRIVFDYTERVTVSGEIVVPGTPAGGDLYILVFGDYIIGDGSYSVNTELLPFEVTGVVPNRVDNTGFVLFTLTGGQLSDVVSVKLRDALGGTIEAWGVVVLNSTKVEASFDLRGAALGFSDVLVVTSQPDSTEASSAVEVVAGTGAFIETEITGPTAVRQGAANSYVVSLRNRGGADAVDIITGVTLAAGVSYQIVLDGYTSPLLVSDGAPILIYTNRIGVNDAAEFTIRLESDEGHAIQVLPVYSVPSLMAAGTETVLVSSWVPTMKDAFCNEVETFQIAIDEDAFWTELARAWKTDYSETRSQLLRTRVDESILEALTGLANPQLPPVVENVVAEGIAAAYAAAVDEFMVASASGRFTKKDKRVTVRVAKDPNEKYGPTAENEDNSVTQWEQLPYVVHFENVPGASASAQQVVITDQLDTDLDWRRFRLGEVAFGSTVINMPSSRSYYHTIVDLESGKLLEIDAGIDFASGEAHWIFNTIDPATGLPPVDPNDGFLPPNDSTGVGQGHVSYAIQASPTAPDGAEVSNSATIVFDANDPIVTKTVVNVVRPTYPDLWVASVSGQSGAMSFIEGEQITIHAAVSNLGEKEARGVTVAFHEGDPQAGGVVIGATTVPELAAAQEKAVEISWTPVRRHGSAEIYVTVDRENTVAEMDETNNSRSLGLEVEPRTYTVTLNSDINLVALPLEPPQPFTARSLSSTLNANMIVRYDTSGVFEAFIPSEQTGEGFSIDNNEGYIAIVADSGTATFSGITHLGRVGFIEGLNSVSLPLEPELPMSARSFSNKIGANLLIRYDGTSHRFEPFMPDFHGTEGFGIRGGEGYLAYCEETASVAFTGRGWLGVQPPQSSSALMLSSPAAETDRTPLFAITGACFERRWDVERPVIGDYTVRAKNLRTGHEIRTLTDEKTGEYSGAFVDLTNTQSTMMGDTIRLEIIDSRGQPAGETVEYVVGGEDVEKRHVRIDVTLKGNAPRTTMLFQNFPNPFNPTTRIRYQIASPGKVSLRIYNVAGQLVKTVEALVREPGYYEALWNGDNNYGEPVASGVYFYTLAAPGYAKSMKLVLVR